MGYCVSQENASFRISHQNVKKALAAIKALAGEETIKGGSGPHFSWVDNDYRAAKSLEDALDCWRWGVQMDANENVIGISFNGEKLGDDERLFRAIAPFVENKCFIQMRGEDGSMWRWVFEDGSMREVSAKVVWD